MKYSVLLKRELTLRSQGKTCLQVAEKGKAAGTSSIEKINGIRVKGSEKGNRVIT